MNVKTVSFIIAVMETKLVSIIYMLIYGAAFDVVEKGDLFCIHFRQQNARAIFVEMLWLQFGVFSFFFFLSSAQ